MIDTLPLAAQADRQRRADILRQFGADEADLDALLDYTENPFDLSGPLVLDDEPFVSVWTEYLAASETEGVFEVLQRALVQLRFPIQEGLADADVYRAVTRRGDLSDLGQNGLWEGGLRLVAPGRLRLELHPTPAGRIPVLTAPVREDFVAIVQALTRKNRPTPLPCTMGALFVSGYNNWDRVRRYRQSWEADGAQGTWAEAFQSFIPQKERYQDRLILLSEGPYSGVSAEELGLDPDDWLRLSHVIRREHECAHYYCRRALGATRSNAHDELIADAMGVLALGRVAEVQSWLRMFITDTISGRIEGYCSELRPRQESVVRLLLENAIETIPWRRVARLNPEQAIRFLASTTLEMLPMLAELESTGRAGSGSTEAARSPDYSFTAELQEKLRLTSCAQ